MSRKATGKPRTSPPSDSTVAETIRRMMGSATGAERKIVRVLLAAYPTAGLETVAELAGRAGVSSPSVVRFVCKLGFSGYPAFQTALRQEIAERFASPLVETPRKRATADQDSIEIAMKALLARLRSTMEGVSRTEFEAVVELLADRRRRIFCLGGRYSRLLAEALHVDLHHLRPGTRVIARGTAVLAETLLDMNRNDVLVVFDYRRYQKDIGRGARMAAAQGVTVVLITDPWLSPIAEVADHVLTASFEGPSPLGSMASCLALVETLILHVTERLGGLPRDRLKRFDDLQSGFVFGEEEEAVTKGLHGGKGERRRKQ